MKDKELNISLFVLIRSYPPIKGVPHEKGYIWLTGKSRSLDYLKFTKNAFF